MPEAGSGRLVWVRRSKVLEDLTPDEMGSAPGRGVLEKRVRVKSVPRGRGHSFTWGCLGLS